LRECSWYFASAAGSQDGPSGCSRQQRYDKVEPLINIDIPNLETAIEFYQRATGLKEHASAEALRDLG